MDTSFTIMLPSTSFKGIHNNQTIEGSFETGKYHGHEFFNGYWIQAVLLNHYQDFESTLKNGMKKNQRVKKLLEFYEWLPTYGSEATRNHFGENSFNNKLKLFKQAWFDQKFLDIMEDYIPIECPLLRQWKFLFNYNKRPLVVL